MRIDIRCCCNAAKIIGSVPLAKDVRPGGEIVFSLKRAAEPLPEGWSETMREPDSRRFGREELRLEVASVAIPVDGGRDVEYVTALKSRDLPVEVFRRIDGFVEHGKSIDKGAADGKEGSSEEEGNEEGRGEEAAEVGQAGIEEGRGAEG